MRPRASAASGRREGLSVQGHNPCPHLPPARGQAGLVPLPLPYLFSPMAVAGLSCCPRELVTKPPAFPRLNIGHQLSTIWPRSQVKQCLPGQVWGDRLGRRVPARSKASREGVLLLLPFSEASTQGPVASAFLLLWAKILSSKFWARKTGGGSGGSPTHMLAPARTPSEVLESR